MARLFSLKLAIAAATFFAGSLLLEQHSAEAAPFQLQFQSVLTNATISNVPGIEAGDTITFEIIVDNGGLSLMDQTWNQADILQATASVESYTASFVPPFTGSVDPVFGTTGAAVSLAAWFDFDVNNTDSLGPGSPSVFVTALITSTGDSFAFADNLLAAGNWTIQPLQVAAISLPPALLLLFAGLAGLGLLGTIKRRDIEQPNRSIDATI